MSSPFLSYYLALFCAALAGSCVGMAVIIPNPAALIGIVTGVIGIASGSWGVHRALRQVNRLDCLSEPLVLAATGRGRAGVVAGADMTQMRARYNDGPGDVQSLSGNVNAKMVFSMQEDGAAAGQIAQLVGRATASDHHLTPPPAPVGPPPDHDLDGLSFSQLLDALCAAAKLSDHRDPRCRPWYQQRVAAIREIIEQERGRGVGPQGAAQVTKEPGQ